MILHGVDWIRHWRRSTWALIAWTALMAAWAIVSAQATGADCLEGCDVYVSIAVLIVATVWLVGAVPLSLLWLVRRPSVPGPEARWGDGADSTPR